MGNDLIVEKMIEKYGDDVEKLYKEDTKKYKEMYDSLDASIKTSLKLSGGVPNDTIMCRIIMLNIMKYINAKVVIDNYINTSDDEVAKFLRS